MKTDKSTNLVTAFLVVVFVTVIVLSAWVSDDAFITFRTVDHLVSGRGAVWNVGERVQAYTHPLWMLLVSLVVWGSGEFFYSTIALSVLLSTACMVLVGFRSSVRTGSAWLAALVLTLSAAFVDYSTSGLENPATHLILVLFLILYLREEGGNRWLFWLSLLAALGAVNRLDTLLLYAPLLISAWIRVGKWKSVYAIVLGFVPLAAWEFFSLVYYGFPFPNTAYAKLNTGIPAGELTHQGVLYLVESAAMDPLTAVAIVAAIVAAFWFGERIHWWIAGAMLLYLAYIVRIGGDFMAGRFLTPLVLMAAILLARAMDWIRFEYRVASIAVFAFVGLVGLILPAQWAGAEILVGPSANGIADERSVYLLDYGLATASRGNRGIQAGQRQGPDNPEMIVDCGGIGIRGFSASPYTQVVDTCGLSDVLLARLPAAYNPEWRIGHFRRAMPDGYLESLQSGENQLADPGLSELYDKISKVSRGEIFDPDRLREIWRLNTGQYDQLVDWRRYRYPGSVSIAASELADGEAAKEMTASGLYAEFDGSVAPTYMKLGLACEAVDLAYMLLGEVNYEQPVRTPSLRFNGVHSLWVTVPEPVRQSGFDTLHVIPRVCEEAILRDVELVDDIGGEAGDSDISLSQALDLYYYAFYRGEGRHRAALLEQLEGRIEGAGQAERAEVPFDATRNILQMPVSPVRELVHANLPASVVTDGDGNSILRYLGYTVDPEETGVEVDIFMEALQTPPVGYVIELRMFPASEPGETIIIQMEPRAHTSGWRGATIQKASADLTWAHDDYEVDLCVIPAGGDAKFVFETSGDPCIPLGGF